MSHETLAANYVSRVLDPLAQSLNVEAARSIVEQVVDPAIQARVRVLADRANEGELTLEERAEYLSYVEASDLLTIFRLKAKQRLEANGG